MMSLLNAEELYSQAAEIEISNTTECTLQVTLRGMDNACNQVAATFPIIIPPNSYVYEKITTADWQSNPNGTVTWALAIVSAGGCAVTSMPPLNPCPAVAFNNGAIVGDPCVYPLQESCAELSGNQCCGPNTLRAGWSTSPDMVFLKIEN